MTFATKIRELSNRHLADIRAPDIVGFVDQLFRVAAGAVLRMICARLGVVCKERTATNISPYGDQIDMEYTVANHHHWHVAFTNTAERQEFLIEAS